AQSRPHGAVRPRRDPHPRSRAPARGQGSVQSGQGLVRHRADAAGRPSGRPRRDRSVARALSRGRGWKDRAPSSDGGRPPRLALLLAGLPARIRGRPRGRILNWYELLTSGKLPPVSRFSHLMRLALALSLFLGAACGGGHRRAGAPRNQEGAVATEPFPTAPETTVASGPQPSVEEGLPAAPPSGVGGQGLPPVVR